MLSNILLLFVCIPTINNLLSVPAEKRNAKYNTTTTTPRAPFRRQIRLPKGTSTFKNKWKGESYYEPYWQDGDWVFHRDSTKISNPFILNEGNTTQHDECNHICPQFVQDYGLICCQKYNEITKKYDYKNFEDYCYMELENCYFASKRWVPIQKGNCTEPMTTHPVSPIPLITRAAIYEALIFGNNTN